MSCIAVSSWGRTKAPPPKKLLSSVLNLDRASDRKCPDAYGGSEAGVFDCQAPVFWMMMGLEGAPLL